MTRQATQTTDLLETPANDEPSALEVSRLTIDKDLFPYFPPDLAGSAQIIPVSATVRRGKGHPLHLQEWTLQVAVAQDMAKEVAQHTEFYAEQIRFAVPTFWPRTLTVTVVPTTREEVAKRVQQISNAWDMRIMQENLTLPPKFGEAILPAPPVDPVEQAMINLQTSFAEATQSAISATPNATLRSDQVIDLRQMERASNRRALQNLLNVSILKRASDVHFEYRTDGSDIPVLGVRLRIDGMLQPLIETSGSLGPAVLNILGKCAGSGVEESAFHMRPQDGKMIIYAKDGRRFDGRLAFVPVPVISGAGFDCTLRLLDSTQAFEFDKLDLTKRNRDTLEWAMGLDHGLIILTGPTGSGKSSTIQACLRKVLSPELKVITIEDPVEYYLPGAEQTQVNSKEPEMSFAALLRSALRRDPDVIFLGEIRDEETAEVAIKASLTGHLVFATIHAKTALEVVDRLVNLGIHRDLVASSLAVVGAQRLVRRITPERWESGETTLGEIEEKLRVQMSKSEAEKKSTIRTPVLKGDSLPGDLGNYYGRIAVHQFQSFDDELKDAISAGKSSRDLYGLARKKGMRTLVEDAIIKVQQGHTSLEEVALVLRGA